MQANALKCHSSTICRHFQKNFDDYEFEIRCAGRVSYGLVIWLRACHQKLLGPSHRAAYAEGHTPKILGNSYNLHAVNLARVRFSKSSLSPLHLARRRVRNFAGYRWDRKILSGHLDSRRIAAKVPPARTIIAVTLWDAHDACTCKSTGFGTEFIYL